MRMKRRRIVAAVLLSTSLVALTLMTIGVQAKALKLSMEYYAVYTGVGVPEKMWVSNGIVHVRGIVITQGLLKKEDTLCTLTFEGVATIVANSNTNTKTGGRTGWGTWMMDGTFFERDEYGDWQPYLIGVAEGTYTLCRKGEPNAQGIGWGTEDDLVGWKIDCFSNPDPDEIYDVIYGGFLLNPHR